jgi:hypothetical protein
MASQISTAGPSPLLDWSEQKVEAYLLGRAKFLLLDQHHHREERPKWGYDSEKTEKITRFDQGVREGEIKGLLNAVLVLRNPNYVPAPGFDHERNTLAENLLAEAKEEEG